MSGEQALLQRLPPSGAEILDATSRQVLRVGSGTPGLVWRGEYSGAGIDIANHYASPVAITGLGGNWALPAGYWYDIEFSLTVSSGVGATVNNLVVIVNGLPTVGLMAIQAWGATALAAAEENTFMAGRVRFYVGTDITSVALVAGASGNAGDRVVTKGFLRIEQYTEGDEPEDVRLNPSGSFVQDATTSVPAQIGSGTPGLVYRATTSTPLDVAGTVPQIIPAFSQAWSMPAGYRYDLEVFANMADTAAGATGNLEILLQGSADSGATWFTMLDRVISGTVLAALEGHEYFAGLVSYVPTVDITNVRCSVAGGVAARSFEGGWLKIEEYVQ